MLLCVCLFMKKEGVCVCVHVCVSMPVCVCVNPHVAASHLWTALIPSVTWHRAGEASMVGTGWHGGV